MNSPVDWGTLWLGGFCPVGALGGLPVRGADYAAHPPLDELLTPPSDTMLHKYVTLEFAEGAWSERLGGAMVVLAIWKVRKKKAVLLADAMFKAPIASVAWSPDDRRIAVSDESGALSIAAVRRL